MVIKNASDIPAREITEPSVYFNRRTFLRAGVLVASGAMTAAIYRWFNHPGNGGEAHAQAMLKDVQQVTQTQAAEGFVVDEPKTSLNDITHYNNFYEFSTDKEEVADAASGFDTSNWKISVGGLCSKPRVFDLDDLMKISRPEERIYRMRCVEAWSMVIPWDGFSLSRLLDRVEPTSGARYVAFDTLLDLKRMPNQRSGVLPWPYVEGLRMDEAMHPLTMLATGIYGLALPPQDGAPVRLVVPWKYGFKGIKSIVKITLQASQPPTTWSIAGPDEYGFYANVNPRVDHPRWSQASERRIGEIRRRPTLMFNGYAEQVRHLYAGMDLRANF